MVSDQRERGPRGGRPAPAATPLDLAEAVAGGRLDMPSAAREARATGPRAVEELADLVDAIAAVRLHAAATREAANLEAVAHLDVVASRERAVPPDGTERIDGLTRVRLVAGTDAGRRRTEFERPRARDAGMLGLAAAIALVIAGIVAVRGQLVPASAPAAAGRGAGEGTLALTDATFADARLSGIVGGTNAFVLAGARYGNAGGERTSDAAVWRSADGRTWVPIDSPSFTGGFISALARDGGRLVAVGSTGPSLGTGDRTPAVWVSDGGTAWSEEPPGSPDGVPTEAGGLRGVTVSSEGLVAVGTLGVGVPHAFALVSSDGLGWQRASFVEGADGRGMTGIVATSAGYFAWGFRQDGSKRRPAIWTSADGLRWTLGRFDPLVPTASADPTAPIEGGEVQAVIGSEGDWLALAGDAQSSLVVFQSTDAISWRAAQLDTALTRFEPAGAIRVLAGGAPPGAVGRTPGVGSSPAVSGTRAWLVLGSSSSGGTSGPAAFTWSPDTGWASLPVEPEPGPSSVAWGLRAGAATWNGAVLAGGTIPGSGSPGADAGAIWELIGR